MKIIIKATHLVVTAALKEYILLRMNTLDRYLGRLGKREDVVLRVEVARTTAHHHKGEVYYVELMLIMGKKTIRIEQQDVDARRAVDLAKDRLKVQMQDVKEKTETRRSRVTRGEKQ